MRPEELLVEAQGWANTAIAQRNTARAERDAALAEVARLIDINGNIRSALEQCQAVRNNALHDYGNLRTLAAEAVAAFSAVENDKLTGYEPWMASSAAAVQRLDAAVKAMTQEAP